MSVDKMEEKCCEPATEVRVMLSMFAFGLVLYCSDFSTPISSYHVIAFDAFLLLCNTNLFETISSPRYKNTACTCQGPK